MASILFNIARICNSQFKCKYLKNEKLFLNFLLHFWNLHQIFKILKEKIIVIAHVFPKFQTVKNFVTPLSKKGRFRKRFDSQHVKMSQILAKSAREHLDHVFLHFEESWFRKRLPSFQVKSKGCFLTHWVWMASILFNIARICNSQFKCKYLKNEKIFLNFLFHVWNLHQILNILKKKMMVIANIFSNL